MKYYLYIKTNQVLIYATTSMNLGNIMLSERGQTLKVTHYMIPLCEISRIETSTEKES